MKNFLVIFFLLFGNAVGYAQLRVVPISHPEKKETLNKGVRIESETPILLPLWDDFSTTNGLLDSAWWMPGSQVQVQARPGNGILPPTLNVVTFDGVDAQGNPYSVTDSEGPVDSLLSRYIDLTDVSSGLRSTVYLSFFFQVKGLGNQPEPEDSLILYFKKADGEWQKMWPQVNDIIPSDPTIFTEKLVNVPNSDDFFHDKFQFMFRAFGRQNGWFDNWNIDYIYLDKRRSSSDNSYLDRAITDLPASILGQYTAMPWNEFIFNSNPGANLTSTSTFVRNLENDPQPIQYTATIKDTLNNVMLETIADDVELLLFPKDLREAPTNIPDPASFDQGADSLYLEIEYFIDSGDKNLIDSIYNAGADTVFYNHINLRVNDTARTYLTIHDYYAYDDGSAEFGAGINQEGGRIAYRYITNTPQYVDRLEIYFPNTSRNQVGTPIDIFVTDELTDNITDYNGISSVAIQHDGINQFSSYLFSKSIFVQDTFYIGFVNRASDGLWTSVGLDKNTNTSTNIFYSISNTWVPNTDIQGSLMMRPHFIDELISSVDYELINLAIYPNPNNGTFRIRGQYDNISLTDVMGRGLSYRTINDGNDTLIQIINPQGRIVIIQFRSGETLITRKILLEY